MYHIPGLRRWGQLAVTTNPPRPCQRTPDLPAKIVPTKIRRLEISGKFPMDMRIPPLEIKIRLESNPLKSRILVRRLPVSRWTWIYIYIYIYNMCIYIYIYIHMCVYIYIYIERERDIYTHVCVYVCIYIYIYIHTYIYTYIHIYIYTYTYKHTLIIMSMLCVYALYVGRGPPGWSTTAASPSRRRQACRAK